MSDAMLRLAFTGLHPDRIRGLVAAHRSAARVVAHIGHGVVETNDRTREAAAVPAATRRDQLAAEGIGFVVADDADYPQRLGELLDVPPYLFVRGVVSSTPSVAVVGTRRCTSYGKRLAESYGRAIADAGWVLVSGLARGIDGAAHRGTVAAEGLGIAVLGCGIDVMYPAEHRGLSTALLERGGALVSEYPPGTPPEGWRFPPRNRIISGLSSAVVVVEAGVKGGALITATAAIEQNLPVFAVPGDVTRDTSRGTNLLIRDGACPVLDPADLIEGLSLVLGAPARATAASTPTDSEADVVGPVGSGATVDEIAQRGGLTAAEAGALIGRWVATGLAVWEGSLVVRKG